MTKRARRPEQLDLLAPDATPAARGERVGHGDYPDDYFTCHTCGYQTGILAAIERHCHQGHPRYSIKPPPPK